MCVCDGVGFSQVNSRRRLRALSRRPVSLLGGVSVRRHCQASSLSITSSRRSRREVVYMYEYI